MNRILLLAHAPLASALRACVLHVFPDAGSQVVAVDVSAQDSAEVVLAQAHSACDGADVEGILVMTDMQGATPGNVARKFVDESPKPASLLCGTNLPMLLRAVTYSGEPLATMLERAQAGGVQGVMAYTPPQPAA